MSDLGEVLLLALGLMLIIEGTGPFAFPAQWRQFMIGLGQLPDQALRKMGFVMIMIGLAVIYWGKN